MSTNNAPVDKGLLYIHMKQIWWKWEGSICLA